MALKTGSEDRKKVAVVAGLGILVVIVFFWRVYPMIAGGGPPAPLPPTVVQTPGGARTQPGAQAGAHEAVKVSGSMASLDPTLHPEWMAAAESLAYAGKGRNIFSMSSAPVTIENPQGPVRPNAQQIAAAHGPPPPPPIDLKFFGYEAHSGGQRKVFLLHGDDVFIASAGDVVDHRYKVVQIAPFSIQVEDIPYSNTQTLPLVQN
jgi:hypothetical protein